MVSPSECTDLVLLLDAQSRTPYRRARREDSLHKAIGEAHRRYTRYINFQKGCKGYLWQGRFASYPMDEQHLLAAVRYIELNPVRAGLTKKPEDYK